MNSYIQDFPWIFWIDSTLVIIFISPKKRISLYLCNNIPISQCVTNIGLNNPGGSITEVCTKFGIHYDTIHQKPQLITNIFV